MFVRWKKGKNKLYCYLCESKRIAGKPVTKTLGALGHYPDNASEIERQQFWQQVTSNLLKFSVPDAEQEKIKAKIAEKVPCVASADQVLTLEYFLEEFPDGVLLISPEARIIHRNQNAQSLLKYLFPDEIASEQVPSVIWQICQSVMDKGDVSSQSTSAIEHSIRLSDSQFVRARAQWFQGTELAVPCLWVSLQVVDHISNTVNVQGELRSSEIGLIKPLEKSRSTTVDSARSASISRAVNDVVVSQRTLAPYEASSRVQSISDTKISTDIQNMQATLLLAAIEKFTVGLLIVAQDGIILHKNSRADALLEELHYPSSKLLPERVWRLCQTLIENEQFDALSRDVSMVLEDEISMRQGTIIVRVQWFDWSSSAGGKEKRCFLITLENRQQSLINIAKQEAQRYGLTIRETDVWCLKRMGNDYKEIARTLYISENTVKKHLKSIYAKKEQSKWFV